MVIFYFNKSYFAVEFRFVYFPRLFYLVCPCHSYHASFLSERCLTLSRMANQASAPMMEINFPHSCDLYTILNDFGIGYLLD